MEEQPSLFPEDREKARRAGIFGTPEWRRRYQEYIRSPQWRKLRLQVIARAKGHCEKCGKLPKRLEVHHLTHERFGHELLTDLIALCNDPCHPLADAAREREAEWIRQERREEARLEAIREAYFSKRYGEDWILHWEADPERLDAEFDRWLEKKESGGCY